MTHCRISKNYFYSLPEGKFSCELIGWSRYALFIGMLKYMYEEDDESTFYVVDSFEGGKFKMPETFSYKSIVSIHIYQNYI